MVNLSKNRIDKVSESEPQRKNKYDRQSKAFFITINNPTESGFTHEHITDLIHTKFKQPIEYWCMCDEMGSTYHTHLYILLSRKKRWSSIQKIFNHCHIESETKGSPQECRAYIRKEGKKYANKAETNYPDTFYEEGSIPSYNLTNDRVEMLLQIEDMIEQDMRPEQIMNESIVFRQYETIIRKQFFQRRLRDTPPLREIKIIWHLGASGSGKSYTYTKLCEKYGEDEVFFGSDYSNNCTALFDGYQAEKVLFLDEIKTDSFKYGFLLQIFQGYKAQIHARYSNVFSLWTEIHATSIYTPDEIYDEMVSASNRSVDSKTQLLRRITDYCYHWKDDNGYHSYQISATEFISYEDLRNRAEGKSDFTDASNEETPF